MNDDHPYQPGDLVWVQWPGKPVVPGEWKPGVFVEYHAGHFTGGLMVRSLKRKGSRGVHLNHHRVMSADRYAATLLAR